MINRKIVEAREPFLWKQCKEMECLTVDRNRKKKVEWCKQNKKGNLIPNFPKKIKRWGEYIEELFKDNISEPNELLQNKENFEITGDEVGSVI